jgi:hypothetical protein
MSHTIETAAPQIAALRTLLAENGRAADEFQICLGGPVTSTDDVARWEELGVTRLIVGPWRRSPEAVESMERFADTVGLEPRG